MAASMILYKCVLFLSLIEGNKVGRGIVEFTATTNCIPLIHQDQNVASDLAVKRRAASVIILITSI